MKQNHTDPLAYITKAKYFYEGLVYGELEPYSSLVYSCLYDRFKIQTVEDIKILKAVSKQLYSNYVYWDEDIYNAPIEDVDKFIHSCDAEKTSGENNGLNLNKIEIDLEKEVNGKYLNSYKNYYIAIRIASTIIKKRNKCSNVSDYPINLQKHKDWSEKIGDEFKNINSYQDVVKFCISYIYYTQKDSATKHFQILPLQFYRLLIYSILKAEFLYVPNYNTILQQIKNDGMNAFTVLPEIVTYGIESICETIDKCHQQYKSLIDSGDSITENIFLQVNIEKKFCNPKYKNEQVSVNTGQWGAIVDIIKLAYETSLIDIAYISSSQNIKVLMSLIKSINDFVGFYSKENISFIGSIDKDLWENISKANDILLIKASILLSQIIEQVQPKDDSSMMPKLHYSISNPTINERMEWVKRIVPKESINPFVVYCKQHGDINVKTITDLFTRKNITPLTKASIIDYDGINRYNEYVNQGIELSIEQTPLYIAIRKLNIEKSKYEDEKDLVDKLWIYLKDKNPDSLHKILPPSLYVQSIKCLCKITKQNINGNVEFAQNALELLDEMINLLRLATLSYKSENTTPYRFRPLFEYSFYEYSNGKINLLKPYEYDSFVEYLAYTDDIFFISSLYFPNPINYIYLENFFQCYNRKVHKLHHEIQKALLASKEKELVGNVASQMNEERKKTIQILGIFGTFIAFVSSIAGMIKSVGNIVDFMLFCMTFVVCLLIFIWCLYSFFTEDHKHSFWKHILATIAILAIIASFTICTLHIFEHIKSGQNVTKSPTGNITLNTNISYSSTK